VSSFNRADYQATYNFARSMYFWHEGTGHGFDIQAALLMQKCEDVLGQQIDFPKEARERLREISPSRFIKLWKELGQ
jgi:hypothetical protein